MPADSSRQVQEPQSLPNGPGIPKRPLFTRIGESLDYILRDIRPAEWMSAGQPIPQSIPESVRGRQMDYAPQRNLRFTPKDEGIRPAMLRGLVRNCDLAQGAISVIKKQMGRLDFTIQKRGVKKTEKQDSIALAIQEALRYPDHEHPFSIFQGMLIEDQVVLDAPTMYAKPNKGGKLWGFEVMDAGTFMRLASSDGRTPFPPCPAYAQILKGQPIHYTTDEILWMPRFPASDLFYGRSETEQAQDIIQLLIRRNIDWMEWFRSGSMPDVLIKVPESWGIEGIERMQSSFDRMKGDQATRKGAKVIPESAGEPYEMKKELASSSIDEILIRKLAFMYDISAGALVREMMRATAEVAKVEAYEQGQLTRMKFWKEWWDLAVARFFHQPDYELVWAEENMSAQKEEAEADAVRIKDGTKTRNEIREDHGDPPLEGGDIATVETGAGIVRVDSFPNLPLTPVPASDPLDIPDPKASPETEPGAAPSSPTAPAEPAPAADPAAKLVKARRRVLKSPKTARAAKARATLGESYTAFLKHAKAHVMGKVSAGWPAKAEKLAKAAEDYTADLDYDVLIPITQGELEEVGKAQVSAVLAQMGTSDEDLIGRANAGVVEYAKRRSAEMVGKKWVNGALVDNPNARMAIDDTMREGIRTALSNGLEKGLSIDEMGAELEARFDFSPDRAETIARTEIARCNTQADLLTWQESGMVMGKMWILSDDHDDRDACDLNASQGVIPLGDAFESGDMVPPQHPRCQCSHAAVMQAPEA